MTVLVVNAGARHGAGLDAAVQALRAAGLDVEAHQVPSAQVRPLVRRLVEEGHTLVAVGGGDGTVNLAARELVHTQAALGILPLGTQNSFARSLGLPLDVEGAARVVVGGRRHAVDVGQAGGGMFVHSVTIGVSTEVAHQAHRLFKRVAGQAAYVLLGSKVLSTHEPFLCRLLVDGQQHAMRTHQVVVTSGGRLGPAELAPDARPDDRRLHVSTVGSASRWAFIRAWAASLTGSRQLPPGSHRFTAQDVLITAHPPQRIDLDGEPDTLTPVRLRVLPGALHVMVPRE